MVVVLLLALIWAAVLVPPALRVHAARQEAFLLSIGSTPDHERLRPAQVRSLRIQRRRRIAGGLLVAMAVTLVVGLIPTFRVLLAVHLFLLNSFIAYIALLAHWANRAALSTLAAVEAETTPATEAPRRWWLRERGPAPAAFPDLAPLA